ncbi:AraC family transcriptional regulator [Neptunicella marina]|uniref:AraC family transcriptional regulator ligand-binding domain-containing protein n=1 Tax=Neptunicella marina TaxID=2125989 RepID=A0A8J6LZ51_9ALTE|nr:AraC family transcriptional regulator [Neptunicella marina]MBC3765875.1 AraC family transcriptional regulator ligand-binding domain-containing protein [Neptunicella marina]
MQRAALKQSLFSDDKFLPAHQLVASLLDIAISRGANKQRLMRGTGIFYEDIVTGQGKISPLQFFKFVANVQAQTNGKDNAFLLGRRLFPGNYGHVSNALMHSRNLSDALRLAQRFQMILCPFVDIRRYQDQHFCHFIVRDALGCGEHWPFIIETYSTALIAASKLLAGKRIPFYVDFPFARPRHIQEYEENIGLRLRFSQPFWRIRVEKQWLNQPFLQPSHSLKQHAMQQALQDLPDGVSFLKQIRQLIQCLPASKLDTIAHRLNMSPATFKRKLKSHGMRFQQLQDELGTEQALYLLQVQGLNNEDSALAMQFSDVTNFRRAVKRWTGLTPSELRLGAE